jgi:hypothetical protein
VSHIILGIFVIKRQQFVPMDCWLLHKSPSVILQMLKEEYGKVAIRKMKVYKLRKHFCEGHASVNNDPRKPSTSTNNKNIECELNVV